jgi:hypothetical protein
MPTLWQRILGLAIIFFAIGSLVYSFTTDPYGDVKEYLPPSDKVVVYYFLVGPKRCDTCMKIEKYTRAAAASHPAGKAIEFSLVNTDAPINQHFLDEFNIGNKSVIVAHYAEEQRKGWTNCEDIWGWVPEGEAVYVKNLHAAIDAIFEGATP